MQVHQVCTCSVQSTVPSSCRHGRIPCLGAVPTCRLYPHLAFTPGPSQICCPGLLGSIVTPSAFLGPPPRLLLTIRCCSLLAAASCSNGDSHLLLILFGHPSPVSRLLTPPALSSRPWPCLARPAARFLALSFLHIHAQHAARGPAAHLHAAVVAAATYLKVASTLCHTATLVLVPALFASPLCPDLVPSSRPLAQTPATPHRNLFARRLSSPAPHHHQCPATTTPSLLFAPALHPCPPCPLRCDTASQSAGRKLCSASAFVLRLRPTRRLSRSALTLAWFLPTSHAVPDHACLTPLICGLLLSAQIHRCQILSLQLFPHPPVFISLLRAPPAPPPSSSEPPSRRRCCCVTHHCTTRAQALRLSFVALQLQLYRFWLRCN